MDSADMERNFAGLRYRFRNLVLEHLGLLCPGEPDRLLAWNGSLPRGDGNARWPAVPATSSADEQVA